MISSNIKPERKKTANGLFRQINLILKTNNTSMKHVIFMGIVLFFSACGGKSIDKKTELETLKKERVEINSKIAVLEAELGTAKNAQDVKNVSVLEVQESLFSNFLEVQGRIDAEGFGTN